MKRIISEEELVKMLHTYDTTPRLVLEQFNALPNIDEDDLLRLCDYVIGTADGYAFNQPSKFAEKAERIMAELGHIAPR